MATTRVGVYNDPRKRHPWIVRWFGEYDPATGKKRRYSKSYRLKRDAERFQVEKQTEFDKGARRDKPGEITLRAFCDKYVKQRRHEWRETTRGNQEDLVNRLLAHFSGGRPIHSISPEQAHRFWMEATPMRSDLKGKKLSRETRNRILREAKTLFEYAVRWEYLPANPFAGLKQQRVGKKDRKDWRFITPSEYRALQKLHPA